MIQSFRRGVELAGSVLEPAILEGVAPGAILAYSSIQNDPPCYKERGMLAR